MFTDIGRAMNLYTFKNGSGLFLHGTHDEGGTTKHN